MPYYDGKWHLYSESERREYGQRRRDQESRNWHEKWISKAGLKQRLWTDKAIADFLDKPKDAGPIKAWLREEVLEVEQTPAFQEWLSRRKAWLIARGKLDTVHSHF
ncbi:TPA: hypothetical protein ACF3I9_004462 [Klebsiella aerogenes]